jgi:hypothetical protein
MPINMGLNGQISLGEESTAGTAVATTVGTQVTSVDIQEKLTIDAVDSLSGSGGTRNIIETIHSMTDVAGSISLNAYYAGGALGMLLKHALGSVSTSGAGPYAHAYSLAAALPNGLTVVVERGNTGSDDKFAGCKISRMTISCAAGEPMKIQVELIGMSATARTTFTPTALTALASRFLVKHAHAGTLGFNSQTYRLKSFELVIDNKLARQDQLGSADSAEPVVTERQEITVSATLVGTTNALQLAHRSQTAGDVTLTFSDSPRSLAFTLHNGVITDYSDPIQGVGVIEQTVTWRGVGDDSDNGLAITLTNADSTAVAT